MVLAWVAYSSAKALASTGKFCSSSESLLLKVINSVPRYCRLWHNAKIDCTWLSNGRFSLQTDRPFYMSTYFCLNQLLLLLHRIWCIGRHLKRNDYIQASRTLGISQERQVEQHRNICQATLASLNRRRQIVHTLSLDEPMENSTDSIISTCFVSWGIVTQWSVKVIGVFSGGSSRENANDFCQPLW